MNIIDPKDAARISKILQGLIHIPMRVFVCSEDYWHIYRTLPNDQSKCISHNKFQELCKGYLTPYIPDSKENQNLQKGFKIAKDDLISIQNISQDPKIKNYVSTALKELAGLGL